MQQTEEALLWERQAQEEEEARHAEEMVRRPFVSVPQRAVVVSSLPLAVPELLLLFRLYLCQSLTLSHDEMVRLPAVSTSLSCL